MSLVSFTVLKTSEKTTLKRKRRTSDEQYETYLRFMQDYAFRSNTNDPTLGENYLEKMWDELTISLNSISTGPQLSTQEWKRRFKDWKNATRQKVRRIEEFKRQNKGQSGVQSELKLTPLEERGLSLWGNSCTSKTTANADDSNALINDTSILKHETFSCTSTPTLCTFQLSSTSSTPDPAELVEVVETPNQNHPILQTPSPPPPPPPPNEDGNNSHTNNHRPLNELNQLAQAINSFTAVYKDVEEKKINLKEQRLKFEMAKFKFLNPSFDFSCD